ncbi:hypothetical protein PVAND_000804 [Polypedilum vanderplanki]|uniref:Single domain-containing protein n=1 Tax=Polypedilum vanderplanki TaxID=319348 RepID=A0A9J6BMD1_POLVA|nr:hypothetical protein PVAND_000804 [Polypedilum vanderplanki]
MPVFIESAKILIVFSTISKSHVMPLEVVAKLLAERNHEVTFFTPFPSGKAIKNLREVQIPFDEKDKEFLNQIAKNPEDSSMFTMMKEMPKLITKTGNTTLQLPEMRRIMKEEKFDLLINGYFMTEFILGLGDHFKVPTIVFSPAGALGNIHRMLGNPLSPSGAPHVLAQSVEFNFVGRIKNFFMNIIDVLVMRQIANYIGKEVYNYNFPPDQYRSYEESLRNVSLVLLNTHFSSARPRPYLPNMIEVGGLQVKPNPSPLPNDLKTFLDEAEDGAILFSLGSNAKSTFLPENTIKTLLKAFSQIKQRVVMKWESDTLKGKPENVFISKWLPQDDVLAHKNIKLFISHCGFGGLIEAKYHGVPILGIPLFADQPANADMIEKEGWGKQISINTITADELRDTINEMITNPKYANVVKQLSLLAKDRPMNAQETAIYWIEYVIRHHGAPHLHYPSADLNFFQDNSLDVIAFLVFTVYVIFKILAFICKKIFCGTFCYLYIIPGEIGKSKDHPGHCYSREHSVLLKVGETTHTNQCEEISCYDDYSMRIAGCGTFSIQDPKCKKFIRDLSKPYPTCCTSFICVEPVDVFETSNHLDQVDRNSLE